MLHINVSHLVRHYTCKFGFVVCGVNRADINEDGPTGKGEGVDLTLWDDMKLIRPGVLLRNLGSQFFS